MTETQTKQPVKKQTSIGLKTCGYPETKGGGVVAVGEDCLSQTCVFVRCIFSSIYILNCNCLLYILIHVYLFIYIVFSSPAYFHPFIILKIYFSPIVHIAPSLLLLPPPPHGERDLALKARLQKNSFFFLQYLLLKQNLLSKSVCEGNYHQRWRKHRYTNCSHCFHCLSTVYTLAYMPKYLLHI